MADWFYNDGAEARGPVPEDVLALWIRERRIAADTLLWGGNGTDWTPAASVPAFAPVFAEIGQGPRPPSAAGRWHHPVIALAAGLAVPGAGQAYNGQPGKALFFLFSFLLVLPWIWSLVDAWRVASRLVMDGGRFGAGGLGWVVIQGWAFANLLLFVLVAFTVAGRLS